MTTASARPVDAPVGSLSTTTPLSTGTAAPCLTPVGGWGRRVGTQTASGLRQRHSFPNSQSLQLYLPSMNIKELNAGEVAQMGRTR